MDHGANGNGIMNSYPPWTNKALVFGKLICLINDDRMCIGLGPFTRKEDPTINHILKETKQTKKKEKRKETPDFLP